MPKLNEETQLARRGHILDAAERCFARAGFHRTSMQDICREAEISPGALYIYFASKEDLIVGLCEREINEFAGNLTSLAEAPDFLAALHAIFEHYCTDFPQHKLQLHVEIGAEAARNAKIGNRLRSIDSFTMKSIEVLIDRVRAQGRIAPDFDSATVTRAMSLIGEGLFWHRALDPDFDPRSALPAIMTMVSALIKPVSQPEKISEAPKEGSLTNDTK